MIDSSGYEEQRSPSGAAAYRLSSARLVRRGRRRELIATTTVVVVLFVVQLPLRAVAEGRVASRTPIEADVPANLSLVVDLLMIIAYVFAAYRSFGMVRSLHPPPRVMLVNRAGVALVVLAAGLDVVEDLRLWNDGGDLSLGAYTTAMRLVLLAGVLLVLTSLGLADWTIPEPAEPGGDGPVPPSGTIIACSGGGIRSAAFSLGALQVLRMRGVYARASHVVGVSGGGYTAAAYHVLRSESDGEVSIEQGRPGPGEAPRVFGEASPEMQWVRRHTRYVLNSLSVATQGVLSLLFGIAVNLVLIVSVLGGLAWLSAWLWLASGRIAPPPYEVSGIEAALGRRFDNDPGGEWWWVDQLWWIAGAGVLLFLAEKVLERHLRVGAWRMQLRGIYVRLLLAGTVVTVLLMGVPWLLEVISRYAASSGSVWSGLLYQLGLVPQALCDVRLPEASACGVTIEAGMDAASTRVSGPATGTINTVTLGTIVAAILAVLGSAKGAASGASGGTGWIGRLWARVKGPAVPYVALFVIAVTLVVLLLRWVSALTSDVSLLERWELVYVAAGLLVAAKLGTEPNRTSLHHFYRERISYAFLVGRTAHGIRPLDYKRSLRFSGATPAGPALVCCAVANVSDEELVPSRRGCTPFVFDSTRIGLADPLLPVGTSLRDTTAYEFVSDHQYRDATIPAAVAISGAAFSPLAGRENVRLGPYRAVLALGNARLGVWLPNPLWIDEGGLVARLVRLGRFAEARTVLAEVADDGQRARLTARIEQLEAAYPSWRRTFWEVLEFGRGTFKKPGLSRLAKEAVGKASIFDRYLYVTDGGHYDNLGLIESLRRRPAEVYVIDASNDPEDSFRTLGHAIASARMDLDVTIDLNPRHMRRLAEPRAAAAWCSGRIRYADGATGRIHLVKAIMLDELSWDVEVHRGDHADFPRTSTSNQLYSEFDFEAYRSLGQQATRRMLDSFDYQGPETPAEPPASAPVPTNEKAATSR